MKISATLTVLFGVSSLAVAEIKPQQAVVIVPVADVWSRPLAAGETPSDDLRETQVLFGEQVLIHESSRSWVRIEAVEQPEFTHHNKWEGYPGWVPASTLSGTNVGEKHATVNQMLACPCPSGNENACFEGLCEPHVELLYGSRVYYTSSTGQHFLGQIGKDKFGRFDWTHFRKETSVSRNRLLEEVLAILSVKTPYLWGGLSVEKSTTALSAYSTSAYGLDCSGLTHLAYRVNGIIIPRDSHEQWMKAKPIKRAELKSADLIFSAKADNPKKITHVALYTGDGQIIEAPQTGMVVRKISFQEKYGKPLDEVESGDKVGERMIYFGSFLQK